jgi:DNA-binding CsgD family transcriptional regulator/TPR repeat protein
MRKAIFFVFLGFLILVARGIRSENFPLIEPQLSDMHEDTVKVNALLKLGTHYCYTDADKALLYLQQALVLSVGLDYEEGVALAFLWQGRAYYYKDEYDLAMRHLEKAREIFEEAGNSEGMIQYHQFMGNINGIKGNYLNAIRNFQSAIDLSRKLALKKEMYLACCGLGNVYLNRSDPVLAKRYFKEALTLVGYIEEPGLESILYANLGKAHELANTLDSALIFYEKSLEKRLSDGGIRMIASSEYNIGSVLMKMGIYDRALQNLESSKDKYAELHDDTGVCINMLEISKGLFYTGNTDEAMSVAHEALALAKKLNNPSLLSDAYFAIAPVMALAGYYDVAYNYMLINNALKDSLALINREKIVSELEVQFQTARISDENKLLKSQNELQHKNILLLYVSLSGSLIILTLVFVLLRLKSNSLKRQQELYKSEKTIGEQKARLREKEQMLLQEQLEAKNRELASKALEMLRINETIGDVIEKLELIRESGSANTKVNQNINQIVSGLESQLKNNSWNEFEKVFTNIHSDFFSKLLNECPDLTSSEIKIAALLKLNLSTKEIAAITFKSEAGIKSTRYRLRKKLGLDNDESLIPYLMRLA